MTSTCRPGYLIPQILSAAAIIVNLTKKTWSTRLPSLSAEGWDSFYIWLSSKVLVKFDYTETWFIQFRDLFFFFWSNSCVMQQRKTGIIWTNKSMNRLCTSWHQQDTDPYIHTHTPSSLWQHFTLSTVWVILFFFLLLLIELWHGAKVSIILCGRLN